MAKMAASRRPVTEESRTMFSIVYRMLVAALMLGITPVAVLAAGEETAKKVLFDTRQLDRIDQGAEVKYRFERSVSEEKLLGKAFADDIKLGVSKVNAKGERDVVLQVFTGDMARNPSSLPELIINPIFVWFLDRSVGTITSLAGGNHMYFKGRLREALGRKAELERIKFDYNGKEIDAYRVTVRPYEGDVNAHKMQGYDGAVFTIVVSDEAPGYFVDLVGTFDSKNAGGPKLVERVSLVGLGESN
jgi:hypothetical protein